MIATPAEPAVLKSSLPLTDSFKPEYLEYHGVLPLELSGGCLRVATTGAPCREVLEDLETTFGAPLDLVQMDRDDLVSSVWAIFSAAESTDSLVRSLDFDTDLSEAGADDPLAADVRSLANQPPVVRYVNLLIREAHEARASDIHFEASAEGPVVRFRIDGVLSEATPPPRAIEMAVRSRLKLIADLDIAERRAPQDGRIRIRLNDQELDLRVSSMPALHGESIVLRLLDRHAAPEGLEALGMDEEVLERFGTAVRGSHGIVLATGPTGSGKTTTLYAALQMRDARREKIITIEDPIEYRLAGIVQIPVANKAGLTFAAGLRSILRQDPDVIMVGEMRDAETARIAVQAAMTGHMVFSTVHTNDAASAVIRLLDMGIEPYLVAATLRAVLAQRLVRRTCSHCGQWTAGEATLREIQPVTDVDQRCFVGSGCAVCRGTGFRGRVGLFELMGCSEAVCGLIASTPEVGRIRDLARREGMGTMVEDGRRKVRDGATTPGEVLRAVQA